MFRLVGPVVGFVVLVLTAFTPVVARDSGQWAKENPTLHAWFDKLASHKGLCCSFADGLKIDDPDWSTSVVAGCRPSAGAESDPMTDYCVRLDGHWIRVPEAALITDPNRAGFPVVWPYQDATGATQIRCFIPGTGA